MHCTSKVIWLIVALMSTSTNFFPVAVVTGQQEEAVTVKESMDVLGRRFVTDKVTFHHYEYFYPLFLERWRDKPIKMLEIGYLLGCSFKMWEKYFPYGDIYAIEKDSAHDKNPPKNLINGVDQSDVNHLEKVLENKKLTRQLDLIVDDGSHIPQHQIISFEYLFYNGLKPGGVYIIEDIEMNYWRKGRTYGFLVEYGKESPESLMNILKDMVDVVNRHFESPHSQHTSRFGKNIDKMICGIYFGHNAVVVSKCTKRERRLRDKKYLNLEYVLGNSTTWHDNHRSDGRWVDGEWIRHKTPAGMRKNKKRSKKVQE